MNKYNKNFGKKLSQRQLQNAILKILIKKPKKSFAAGTIALKIKSKNSKDSIRSAISLLLKDKKVVIDYNKKYSIHPSYKDKLLNVKTITLEGRVDLTASGGAYVIVEGKERDVYVPPRYVNGALHGDTVELEIYQHGRGRRSEGKVRRIIKRKRTSFIGVFQDFKKYGYVFVETPKMSLDIRVLPEHFNNAEGGDGVVVDVIDFGKNKRHEIIGKVVKILPRDNRNDFEMNSILVNNGFEIDFSPEALKEIKLLDEDIHASEILSRRDLRNTLTFTIDPRDAKDFDDAISIQYLENNLMEIGVHIADVSHYVLPDSALDKAAYIRSTSVYLVDRVCPMLPERLSNELCSLRPNEDKLTFSVLFTFDESKTIRNVWIGKTIIHSNKRFTYEEAQLSIDEESQELKKELKLINDIAKSLNKKRFEEGSINFDSDEVKFELDNEGFPIKVVRKIRKDSHKLVEEFMLLANKSVAKFLSEKAKSPEVPFVYRVHDLPDSDRLMELAILASEFGIKLNFDTPRQIAKSLNVLSSDEIDEDLGSILRPMAIRSMAKAEYSSNNIGHYGLGFSHYSHFTSPIRRYSDVLAHRILHENLKDLKRVDKKLLEERCHYISLRERDAVSAERESIKYKQVEYYTSKIGSIENGVIRNIIDKGLFIELSESQADGFIPLDSLGEMTMMHPAKIKVTGLKTKRIWCIGDKVSVTIENTDMDKRQIDLRLHTNTLDS